MENVSTKVIVEYTYDTISELVLHEKEMVKDGYKVVAKHSPIYTGFYRRYAKRRCTYTSLKYKPKRGVMKGDGWFVLKR